MKEPYREGVANHPDPESCVAGRKVGHEALTGAQAGWVLSREMRSIFSPAARRERLREQENADRRDGELKMDWTKPGRFGRRIAYMGIETNRRVLFGLAALAATLNIPLPCGHTTAGAPGLQLS